MDYDSYSKDTFIHEEEAILFRRWLEEVAINEECITFQDTIRMTNSLVAKRRTDILTGHSISETAMREWLKKNNFLISQPLSSYKANARMDQSTVRQLFENMKMLRDSEKYPKNLILNMNECWVSTENKQYHGKVIHTKEIDPIHNQTADGKHVTLIGCIAADGEFVEPSYIIPSPLLNKKKVEDYCLRKGRPSFSKVDI